MTEGFKVSPQLTLPVDAATWTFACLAIKGAGKTYAACDLAEEMVKAGTPIIALDGLGIWWGLRVGVDKHGNPDSSKPGLPIVIFGGQHKDLPIPFKFERNRQIVDEQKLKLMVKAILEARVSAVLDTSEFSKGMQRRIVAIFVNELYHLNAPYGVRHVFIEEADLWCPQRIVGPELAASTGAIDDLVRRGGNFNLGCTLITQRSAVLNKDVLTQANCLIVLRILHKLDKKAVETWVESMAQPDDPRIKKWYDSLRELENGEAWIWHPQEPVIFKRIQFRKRETLHATREFFRRPEAQAVKMMDVGEFVEKYRKAFEPKPQVRPVEKPKLIPVAPVAVNPSPERNLPPLVQEAIREQEIAHHPQATVIARWPPEPQQQQSNPQSVLIQHTLPNVIYQRNRPDLLVPDEPSSPIGRVLAVLMKETDKAGNKLWTGRGITEALATYQYPADGLDEALRTLIHWEFLAPVMKGTVLSYRFQGRERIQLQDIKQTLSA